MRRTKKEGAPATLPVSCGACGRQGHRNDPAKPCPLPPAPWAKLGVEIEGFWDGRDSYDAAVALAEAITGSQGDSDGSLRVGSEDCDCGEDDCEDDTHRTDGWYSWEFRTRPGSLTEAMSQVMRLYPDGTNDTAGMHVHTSFRTDADMALLKCDAFFAYWEARWTAWGERMKVVKSSNFWSRLRGENRYCWSPRSYRQQYGRDSNLFDQRYMQLNFNSAYSVHRTVECRLLPMFRDLRLALSAIAELADIYDAWITGNLWAVDLATANPEMFTLTEAEVPASFDDHTLYRHVEWAPPDFTPQASDVEEHLPIYATHAAPGHRLVSDAEFRQAVWDDPYGGYVANSIEGLRRRGMLSTPNP